MPTTPAPTQALGVLEDLVRLLNNDVAELYTEQVKQGVIPRSLPGGADDPGAQLYALVADYCRAHPDVGPDEARRLIMSDAKNAGWCGATISTRRG